MLNTKIIQPNSRLLLAVSGGVDSMVLLDLILQTNHKIAIAHCNFQLRTQSKEEEELIRRVAKKHSIPVYIKRFDTKIVAQKLKLSIQMAARQLRYAFFDELVKQHQLDYILTAHHLNDQIETIILNLAKGSGIQGLSGIPEVNGRVLRPLLSVRKEEILRYATNHHIEFLEDESNQSNDYERNFIRNEIVPKLKELNPNLEQTMSKSIQYLQFASENHQRQVQKMKNKLIQQDENGQIIHLKQLQARPFARELFYEFIQEYGFQSAQSATIFDQMLEANTGAIFYSKSHQIVKDRNRLLIAPLQGDFPLIAIQKDDERVQIGQKILRQEQLKEKEPFSAKSNVIQVDAELLEYPLLVRKWIPGDYFYPLGLGKKQKLKRFFSNEKFSALDKQNTLLLCSGNKVVWIIGHRMDHRFRVTENTKKIIQFELK